MGGEIVIVEVKTTLRVGLVDKFIERLHRAKGYMPEYGTHTVFGVVASICARSREATAMRRARGYS